MHTVITATAPSHWASYLINGDASGLDDGEETQCDAWIASIGLGPPVDVSETSEFSTRHDAWEFCPLAGDVSSYSFLRPWTRAAYECDGTQTGIEMRATERGRDTSLVDMVLGDRADAYTFTQREKLRARRGIAVAISVVQWDCIGDLLEEDDEIANRFCKARSRRSREERQFRITYMLDGSGQYTGIGYDRLVIEESLRKFRGWTKAWMQESTDSGRTWRTLD